MAHRGCAFFNAKDDILKLQSSALMALLFLLVFEDGKQNTSDFLFSFLVFISGKPSNSFLRGGVKSPMVTAMPSEYIKKRGGGGGCQLANYTK